jgi:hypothetical protein
MQLFFLPAKIARQISPVPGLVVALWAMSLIFAPKVIAVELAPHTAQYKLTLISAKRGNQIETVTGDILVRWRRDCAGWTMTNRTILNVGYGSGGAIRITIDAATWEAAAGDRYTFLITTTYDGRKADTVEGSARLDKTARTAEFILPDKKTVSLPPDTVFPMQHTKLVLEAAQKGIRVVPATVFDGFSDSGSQFVNAIVGAGSEISPEISRKFPGLKRLNTWNVNLAYFADDSTAAEPESEIATKIAWNGIAEWMDMDFGDFRVRGDLTNLDIHKATPCP